MAGLMTYLAGPGRANEHEEQHIVAGDPAIMAWYDDGVLDRESTLAIARGRRSARLYVEITTVTCGDIRGDATSDLTLARSGGLVETETSTTDAGVVTYPVNFGVASVFEPLGVLVVVVAGPEPVVVVGPDPVDVVEHASVAGS